MNAHLCRVCTTAKFAGMSLVLSPREKDDTVVSYAASAALRKQPHSQYYIESNKRSPESPSWSLSIVSVFWVWSVWRTQCRSGKCRRSHTAQNFLPQNLARNLEFWDFIVTRVCSRSVGTHNRPCLLTIRSGRGAWAISPFLFRTAKASRIALEMEHHFGGFFIPSG